MPHQIHVAIGHNKYGLGFSIHQALEACRPNDDEEFDVMRLPESAYDVRVDDWGTVYWGTGAAIDHDVTETPLGRYRAVRDEHFADEGYDWKLVA